MTNHSVTHTRKDRAGDILAIGVKDSWSLDKATAIRRIEAGTEGYYVPWPEGSTWIRVVNGATGKYLRTDRDSTSRNNLDDLPDL